MIGRVAKSFRCAATMRASSKWSRRTTSRKCRRSRQPKRPRRKRLPRTMSDNLSKSTAADAATMAEGESGNVLPMPKAGEVVTDKVLSMAGLNAQAFSGEMNPSPIYRQMVSGSPSVFPYYREIEEKDTAIASALETRRILALAREAKVQSADPASGEAQRYAQGLSEFLEAIPKFREACAELLDAPAYGYSVLEINWNPNESGVWCGGLI